MDFTYFLRTINFGFSFPKIDFSGIHLRIFSLCGINNVTHTKKPQHYSRNFSIFNYSFCNPPFLSYTSLPLFTLPALTLNTSYYNPYISNSSYYSIKSKTPTAKKTVTLQNKSSKPETSTAQKTVTLQNESSKPETTAAKKTETLQNESSKPETTAAKKTVNTNIKTQENQSADFTPKTKKVKINSKLTVNSEEIKPGYYIKKLNGVNIQGLQPQMKDALIKMNEKATELGYDLVISSAYRSHEQQKNLKKEKPKLAAGLYKSAHEYGVAIDLGLYKNGKKVSVDQVKEFAHYGEALGLTWGGRWKKPYEPWHFNINNWQNLTEVRDEYRSLNHLA